MIGISVRLLAPNKIDSVPLPLPPANRSELGHRVCVYVVYVCVCVCVPGQLGAVTVC